MENRSSSNTLETNERFKHETWRMFRSFIKRNGKITRISPYFQAKFDCHWNQIDCDYFIYAIIHRFFIHMRMRVSMLEYMRACVYVYVCVHVVELLDKARRWTLHLATTPATAAAAFAFTSTTLMQLLLLLLFFLCYFVFNGDCPHSNHERCVNVHRFNTLHTLYTLHTHFICGICERECKWLLLVALAIKACWTVQVCRRWSMPALS